MTEVNKSQVNKSQSSPELGGRLGILTKSCATPEFKGLAENAVRTAAKYSLQNESVKLLPTERVRFCLRHRIDASENVTVRYNENREKAHYANVQRCGSVWVCPICSAQISEGRRQELKQGIERWQDKGGQVLLMTLTIPHYCGDNLQQLVAGLQKALHRLWTGRKGREALKLLGKVGHITATEVTHGVNGWHPHFHILMFFEHPVDADSLRNFMSSLWQNACEKSGLKVPSHEHGVDIRAGEYADRYVNKWGLQDEVTKGHIKKGRNGSMTPWDLLRASEGGCEQSGYLYTVFAAAFKGKRQLSWSKGLKALLLVDEVTDEQLATETDKDSIEVENLAQDIWKLILRFKARAAYLQAVEHDVKTGSNFAYELVMSLAERFINECPDELMKYADMHKVRFDALAACDA